VTDAPLGLQHFPDSEYLSHPAHARIGITPFPAKLNVVTTLSNPVRSRNRYHNYWLFEKAVQCAGAVLWTAEIAFGDRPFEVTQPDNPHHLQLRTRDELWHKENALNLMMARIPRDEKCGETYVAWVDADVTFSRPDWAQETLQLLQHYDVIQMFSHAQDLDHDESPMEYNLHQGFMYLYHKMLADPLVFAEVADQEDWDAYYPGFGQPGTPKGGAYMHPGYAWAARMSSLEKVGMLMDWPILGSADWHMAWGLIGQMKTHIVPALSHNYQLWCAEWQNRAEQLIKRN
jgi:hypothetical protein